jgi:DNA integrity scanning protein DisA with diadenylate cyclase activity
MVSNSNKHKKWPQLYFFILHFFYYSNYLPNTYTTTQILNDMKNKLSIMLLLLCQIVFSQDLEKTASDFVNNLFTKRYTESIKLEDDEVKDKMTEAVLEMVNGQLSGMFGDYKK